MNIINEVISILENEGYSTYRESESKLLFEDESLCGFISIHNTIKEIANSWNEIQNEFVKKQTNQLRGEIIKAFNIYSIFLTSDEVGEHRLQINNALEDFTTSRKIIGYGISTNQDIKRILLPLVSIQKKSKLEMGNYLEKIKARLNIKEIISDRNADDIFKNLI